MSPHGPLRAWILDIERAHPHSTARAYVRPAVNVWMPQIGDYRLSEVVDNPDLIGDALRNTDITAETARNYLIPLRAIFSRALSRRQIPSNPLDHIDLRYLSVKKSTYMVDPYSLEEISALLKAAPHEFRPYWQFAFFSGLRTSELYALPWCNINWKERQAKIDSAIVEGRAKGTKTKSSERTIDLLPMAYKALKDQKQINRPEWSDHVFINPRTKRHYRNNDETNGRLKTLCKKAGVRFRNQYQTRHSYASNLLSGGENIYYAAYQLGHKNIEMVMRTYGRYIEQGREKQKLVSEFALLEAYQG